MFIGHIGVAFAARRAAPRASLGVLVGAAMLIDFLWPVFLLAGWERVEIDPGNTAVTPLAFVHYPLSHSLVLAFAWALAAAGAYWALTRYRTGAIAVGIAAASHWFLDALVHRPDLPLYPGSPSFAGLGLWNSVPATVLLEAAIFIAGVWLYARGTNRRDRAGTAGFWMFVAFLALLYAANLAGPPPPGVRAVAFVALAALVFPAWAAWFDRRLA